MATNLRFRNFPIDRIEWITSTFLILTATTSLFVVPWFCWAHWNDPSVNWPVVWISFAVMCCITGLSITLGYHRMFSHIAFKGTWPVKLGVLIFGASTFQNSALDWSHEHRIHHKHVDEHDDPYDISKGFFYAHIGWLLFKLKPKPPFDCVKDLMADKLVMWQHKWVQLIALLVSFVIPWCIGYFGFHSTAMAWALLLVPGVLRVTFVQHCTFAINSLCHTLGKQPYATDHSARDSWICALVTFGEGYHNYHHEFQHDYRNGVKWWQFDPTKWSIWTLSKIGLASDLRTVPDARILAAEMTEARRSIDKNLVKWTDRLPAAARELKADAIKSVHAISEELLTHIEELKKLAAVKAQVSRERAAELRARIAEAGRLLDEIRLARA